MTARPQQATSADTLMDTTESALITRVVLVTSKHWSIDHGIKAAQGRLKFEGNIQVL